MFRYILHIKKTYFLFEGLDKVCVLKNLLLVEEKSRFGYNMKDKRYFIAIIL